MTEKTKSEARKALARERKKLPELLGRIQNGTTTVKDAATVKMIFNTAALALEEEQT